MFKYVYVGLFTWLQVLREPRKAIRLPGAAMWVLRNKVRTSAGTLCIPNCGAIALALPSLLPLNVNLNTGVYIFYPFTLQPWPVSSGAGLLFHVNQCTFIHVYVCIYVCMYRQGFMGQDLAISSRLFLISLSSCPHIFSTYSLNLY